MYTCILLPLSFFVLANPDLPNLDDAFLGLPVFSNGNSGRSGVTDFRSRYPEGQLGHTCPWACRVVGQFDDARRVLLEEESAGKPHLLRSILVSRIFSPHHPSWRREGGGEVTDRLGYYHLGDGSEMPITEMCLEERESRSKHGLTPWEVGTRERSCL